MLRCSGGKVRAFDDTSRSPTWISPAVGSRKPAISRKVVVLPQPEGPSRQTSCPWSIRSETLSTTASSKKRLVRPRSSTDANQVPPIALQRRCRLVAGQYKHEKINAEKAWRMLRRLHFRLA